MLHSSGAGDCKYKMPEFLGHDQIQSILQIIGKRVPSPSRLILLGGGALALLGSPRLTIDFDYIGDDLSPGPLDEIIMRVAKELEIFAEPVPLERFIPLPAGNSERAIFIGKFENLEVFVADPYSIALSKLERGFDFDIEDIIFLIQHAYIEFAELEQIMLKALPRAAEFDINTAEISTHLETVRARMK